MNNSGEFLSFCEFNNKYNIETNFLQCYQITSAIPKIFKVKAFQQIGTPLNLFHSNTFYFSKNVSINLEKFRCKQFYNLLMEKQTSVPAAVKSWGRNYPNIANQWDSSIRNIYQITCDNKLRQFSFKLLHRILVTNKELDRFGIANDVNCVMCDEPDSLEHTFLECRDFLKLLEASLLWFNV